MVLKTRGGSDEREKPTRSRTKLGEPDEKRYRRINRLERLIQPARNAWQNTLVNHLTLCVSKVYFNKLLGCASQVTSHVKGEGPESAADSKDNTTSCSAG